MMLAHYLPQMYLSRFAVGDLLHVYDRETKKLRRDKPRNVAVITDYYTLVMDTGRNDEVEYGFLAGIEGAAAPALARLARGETISGNEHGVIAVFLALLCVRVPRFDEAFSKANQELARITFRRLAGTPQLAAKFLARQKGSASHSAEQFSEFVNSDRFTMPPDQNERIRQMIKMAEPLVAAFEQMDWWLLRPGGAMRFVTSDAPMGLIPLPEAPVAYGCRTPNVLRFVALSPETCLLLADCTGERPILAQKVITDEDVAEINRAIALAASRLIIGRDQSDVDAVVEAAGEIRGYSLEIVEWFDAVENRSLTLSVAVRHDTLFPLELPMAWNCRGCGRPDVETLVVSSEVKPTDPLAYTRWFDRPCGGCGMRPRQTKSSLTREELIRIAFPEI